MVVCAIFGYVLGQQRDRGSARTCTRGGQRKETSKLAPAGVTESCMAPSQKAAYAVM